MMEDYIDARRTTSFLTHVETMRRYLPAGGGEKDVDLVNVESDFLDALELALELDRECDLYRGSTELVRRAMCLSSPPCGPLAATAAEYGDLQAELGRCRGLIQSLEFERSNLLDMLASHEEMIATLSKENGEVHGKLSKCEAALVSTEAECHRTVERLEGSHRSALHELETRLRCSEQAREAVVSALEEDHGRHMHVLKETAARERDELELQLRASQRLCAEQQANLRAKECELAAAELSRDELNEELSKVSTVMAIRGAMEAHRHSLPAYRF